MSARATTRKGGTRVNGMASLAARIGDAVRLRYLGFGFVLAWIYCAFGTSAVYADRAGMSINADTSWLASAATVVVCLFAFGTGLRRADLSHLRGVFAAAAVLMAVGTFASAFSDSFAVSAACGVATGAGSALLFIFWGDAYSRVDAEQAEVAVPAASAVMVVCTFVFPYVEGVIGVVGVSSLPLLSAFCLSLTYDDVTGAAATGRAASDPPAKTTPRPSVIVRLLVLVFVVYAVIGFASAQAEAQDIFQATYGFDAATLIGSISGLAFAVWFILYSPRVDVSAVLRWLIPLLTIGIAFLPGETMVPEFISAAVLDVTDTVMQVVVMLYFTGLARRKRLPAALGIGLSQGALQLGVLVGNLAGVAVVEPLADGALQIESVALFMVCVLSVAASLVPQTYVNDQPTPAPATTPSPATESTLGTKAAPDDAEGKPADLAASATSAGPAPSPGTASTAVAPISTDESLVGEQTRQATVARLAAERGLTAREAEILDYLSRGRSQPYIRETLVLSKNTVSTHVKHIYQKLDVHSKQELLDLFENAGTKRGIDKA